MERRSRIAVPQTGRIGRNRFPTKNINVVVWRLVQKCIKTQPSALLRRISAEPTPCARIVVSVSVVKQPRLIISAFRAEPERIDLRVLAAFPDQFPEGAVFILRRRGTGGLVHERDDVAIEIIRRRKHLPFGCILHQQQPADPARALQRSAEVFSPSVSAERLPRVAEF